MPADSELADRHRPRSSTTSTTEQGLLRIPHDDYATALQQVSRGGEEPVLGGLRRGRRPGRSGSAPTWACPVEAVGLTCRRRTLSRR